MLVETYKKRRPRTFLRGLFLLAHPIPVAFHVIAVALFVLLAMWPVLHWTLFLLIVGAHAAMQLAIAILNDFCDRRADEQSKKQKPIPLGLITPREALCIGLLCIALMLILLFPLNRLTLLISLLYLALGLGYNLGLKATPLSGVVFALAIPLIPVYAFVGANRFAPFLGWFIPIAALLGVAINLANSLPDIEEDRTSKVYTLAVMLGIQNTYLVCTLCLLLGAALIGFLTFTQVVPAQNLLVLSLLVIVCPGILIAYIFFRARQEKYLHQRYFYIVVCASLLLAVGWLIGVLI